MENRETMTGQAVQCKKTDWFKKIYGDMIGDEELKSITLPDGTKIEIDTTWIDSYLHIAPRRSTVSARVTTTEDEMIERILNSEDSAEETNNF